MAGGHPSRFAQDALLQTKTGKGALIGGDRSGAFGGKSSKGAEKKDTTDQIWIGGESFPLSKTPGKGNKKRAMLEWKQLHAALGRAGEDPLPDFGGLRGTLFLDRDEVLPDSKVNTIMKAAKLLDPKKDVRDFAPRSNYHIHKDDPPRRPHRRSGQSSESHPRRQKKKKSGMGFVASTGTAKAITGSNPSAASTAPFRPAWRAWKTWPTMWAKSWTTKPRKCWEKPTDGWKRCCIRVVVDLQAEERVSSMPKSPEFHRCRYPILLIPGESV
jgi:hypothetical protein